MILDIEPGDKVVNPSNKDWGIGQVQSIINDKITVNFENVGKKTINLEKINLEIININANN
jgi:transcription elongation factor GreA-like protein